MDFSLVEKKMLFFLQQEVKDRGFERVIFGLSGGIDSAVVACLCQKAFGGNAKALLMPSSKSSKQNFDDALMLAHRLNLAYEVVPLDDYEKIFGAYEHMDKQRYGNFCARTRMMILYDRSFLEKALVVGTSNKSEILLGYGTIYGDLAYAINPIGNLLKTEIFEFAQFLGIPQKIIDKKPSADLYENQSDEEELGFSYQEIDGFLKEIIERKLDFSDLSLVFDKMRGEYREHFLRQILHRIQQNKFKTQQPKYFIYNDL